MFSRLHLNVVEQTITPHPLRQDRRDLFTKQETGSISSPSLETSYTHDAVLLFGPSLITARVLQFARRRVTSEGRRRLYLTMFGPRCKGKNSRGGIHHLSIVKLHTMKTFAFAFLLSALAVASPFQVSHLTRGWQPWGEPGPPGPPGQPGHPGHQLHTTNLT